jgi:hypothetical protein
MKKFDDSDRNLVNFLQSHRPSSPSEAIDLEEQIIELVDREDVLARQKSERFFWAIPSAIIAGVVIGWGSYRSLIPQTQVSVTSDELEIFLVNSWNNGVEQNSNDPSLETTPVNSFLTLDRKTPLALSPP